MSWQMDGTKNLAFRLYMIVVAILVCINSFDVIHN